MGVIRGIFRLLHLVAHLFKGLFLSYTKLHGTQSHDLTEAQHEIIQTWLHRSAEIIGIDIQLHGKPSPPPIFVVANHISWIDILIISSVLPISFLSKAEIRNWPVIGTLAAKAGTLFIHRGSKNGAAEAIELMKTKLTAGQSVASFPEAKTTHGFEVHIFHPRLFAAAIETEVLIQPVAIRYPHEDGTHPHVPYVDEPNIIKHSFRIMCTKSTLAEITFCNPIECNTRMRKELANSARNAIAQVVEE